MVIIASFAKLYIGSKVHMSDIIFSIPYRLQTPEDILRAKQCNFLNLGEYYPAMYELAKTKILVKPPALQYAKESAEATFSLFKPENKTRTRNVSFEELVCSWPRDHFEEIRWAIPSAQLGAGQIDIVFSINRLPAEVRNILLPSELQTPLSEVAVAIAIKKHIRFEMRAYIDKKRFSVLSLKQFRDLFAAYTLSLSANEDAYHALNIATESQVHDQYFQHALAELLFVRIPSELRHLAHITPRDIKKMISSRIEKLGLTNRQKLFLAPYLKSGMRQEDVEDALKRIDTVSSKLLKPDVWQKLHGYIESIKMKFSGIESFYNDIFLTKQLELVRRLHTPFRPARRLVNYQNIIKYSCTTEKNLQFFPCKDYLDLCKNRKSKDCTEPQTLGKNQLLTPFFFNIRVFNGARWIGNAYMLDLTKSHCGVLLVDRIQIARSYRAEYVDFFVSFRKVMEELFSQVDYSTILLPARISNHNSIQKVFNAFKKKLPRKDIATISSPHASHFESIDHKQRYYVLINKTTNL